jgi:hypothetical protein
MMSINIQYIFELGLLFLSIEIVLGLLYLYSMTLADQSNYTGSQA